VKEKRIEADAATENRVRASTMMINAQKASFNALASSSALVTPSFKGVTLSHNTIHTRNPSFLKQGL